MDSYHDIAPLPPLRAEFAGGTFRGITTRKDGTHCAVILLPNKATERRNWQACVDWAREAGGELPTRSVFHLLRLSATKEELAEGGWHYTADLLSDDTGGADDAAYAWLCNLNYGYTDVGRKGYEGLAVAVRLIPLKSPAKVGGDGLIEQHARDSTELRRLCAARDEARRTAEYWKANHLAGNAEIERLKKLLEAKVGGDEREVQSHFERQGWEVLPIHTFSELTEAIRDYVQAHAALSADGGETLGQKKAAFLKHEGAVETGVMLRAENRIALVAHQGRVEWYDANEFGGIQLSAEGGEDKRDAERWRELKLCVQEHEARCGEAVPTLFKHNWTLISRLMDSHLDASIKRRAIRAAIAANQAHKEQK